MRHARRTPKTVTVTAAGWLAMSGMVLACCALGAGSLKDVFGGHDGGALVARSTAAGQSADSSAWAEDGSLSPAGRTLHEGPVVRPSEVPNGEPLPGNAPAAQLAKNGNYRPFVPTSIRLPSGRIASIQRAGVLPDGALEIPANPDTVGWWTGGAKAGEPYGTTVLAGHVDSRVYGVGFLAEVLKMRPGQQLKLGNGKLGQTYLVQTVRNVPKASLAAGTTLFDQNLDNRLVVITCGGPFDRQTHHYRDNVVLTASPIG